MTYETRGVPPVKVFYGAVSTPVNSRKFPTLPESHKSLTSLQRNLAYFSSTSRSDFPNHSLRNRSHSVRAMHDRVNYRDHCTGKTPFHVPTQLPLYKKDVCNTEREYQPKSLEGGFMDRQLAQVFLQNNRSGGDLGAGRKLSSETTHGSFYVRHTKDGRGESCKPQRQQHVGNEQLMETEAISRTHYPNFDRGLARRFRGELLSMEPPCACTNLPLVPLTSQTGLDFADGQIGFNKRADYPKVWKPGSFNA